MVAVIGDIHGCFNTLKKLYAIILKKYPDIPVYAVGDLVDRGKFSYEVVEFVRKNKINFTAGNHDYMFYYFIKHPSSMLGRSWVFNGSETTLDSYSNRFTEMNKHLNIIIKAPLILDLNDCFICHAGISSHYSRTLGSARRQPLYRGDHPPGRAAVVYSPNNLLGAFARDPLGRWLEPCNPWGERQRRLAFHLAVNVVLYALCSDYKQDRIHVPFLRQRS